MTIENFPCLLLDPPWLERGAGEIKRGADRHYPLLATHDIPRVVFTCPLWRPAPNAHLYLWATNNFLEAGLFVMHALGFRYVTNVAWVKGDESEDESLALGEPGSVDLQIGLGQYFRGQHELLLFGVRGSGLDACSPLRNLGSVIVARRGQHSAKPVESYERIEARSVGPRAEIFARSERAGWTSWGNELPAQTQITSLAQEGA